MKKQHLTNEQAVLLGNYNLTGSALFEALEHIEGCEICRLKVPTVSSDTIFKRLSETELPPPEAVTLTDSKKPFPFGWAWGFGFAACLIGLSVGLYYFTANTPENDLTANKKSLNQPANINSSNITESQSSEAEKTETAEIDNKTQPENEIIRKPKQVNAVIAKNKTPEIIQPKSSLKVEPKEIAKKSVAPNNQTNFDERSNLEKFLVKIPATIVNLRPNVGNIRSGNIDDSQLVLSPNGEVIRETQPDLSWNKIKNAKTYQVSVTDKNYKEAVNEKTVENKFKVKTPLKRGQTYIFTVTAEKEDNDDSTPNKPAIFRVASAKVVKDLERAEKTGKDWKVLSVTLNEGMLSESEKTLNNILSKNPKDKLAVKLLKRVKSLLESAKTAD
jgi:hypothetical protein